MEKIHLKRTFEAPPEKVWELIVDPDQYREWTAAFSPGSEFIGSWEKGSKIRFVAADSSGTMNGMLSEIAESIWPEHISLRHLGLLVDGVEDTGSPMARKWTPAYENYRLRRTPEGGCVFEVDQDIPEDALDEFTESWEKALDRMAHQLRTSNTLGEVIALEAASAHSPETIWRRLVEPELVQTWNFASEDWHCPTARNELKPGGEFHYEMAARDGSASFDFWGTYTLIREPEQLEFTLGDGRRVWIGIDPASTGSVIRERFEPERENSLHLQRLGWQNILNRLAE